MNNNLKKQFISIITGVFFSFFLMAISSQPAFANATENGSSYNCPHPGGTRIAGYSSGEHQIPGGSRMSGSDYVYKVGEGIYIQCFCPDHEGQGIKSTWIHESRLSDQEWNTLSHQGWRVIHNGHTWGLPQGSYLVSNTSFNCDHAYCEHTAYKHDDKYQEKYVHRSYDSNPKKYDQKEKDIKKYSYKEPVHTSYTYEKEKYNNTKYSIHGEKYPEYKRYQEEKRYIVVRSTPKEKSKYVAYDSKNDKRNEGKPRKYENTNSSNSYTKGIQVAYLR